MGAIKRRSKMVEGEQEPLFTANPDEDGPERPDLTPEQAESVADAVRRTEKPEGLEARLAQIRKRIEDSDAEVNAVPSRAREEETSAAVLNTLGTVDMQMDQEAAAEVEHGQAAARLRAQKAAERAPHQEVDRRGRDLVREAMRLHEEGRNEAG